MNVPTPFSSCRAPVLGLTFALAVSTQGCGRDGGPRPGLKPSVAPANATPQQSPPTVHSTGQGEGAGEATGVAPAENIILIIGDGMGRNHVELGRRFNAEVGPLNMDSLEEHTTMSTVSAKGTVTDSAASATAIASGQITANARIGMSADGKELHTIFDDARALGKGMALLTTSQVHDATPAAFATHALSRTDADSIIGQLAGDAAVDVLLGAGETTWKEAGGLTALRKNGHLLVNDSAHLDNLEHPLKNPLVGLFSATVGDYDDPIVLKTAQALSTGYLTLAQGRPAEATDPTLPQMLSFALDELKTHEAGFIVVAENELTDELSHQMGRGQAEVKALLPYLAAEVIRVDETVGVALEWIAKQKHPERTLLIVTADHETCGLDLGKGTAAADALAHATCLGTPHTDREVDVWASGAGISLDSVKRNADLYDVMADAWGRRPKKH